MSNIKYVQLEPAAFLTDIDFQLMDSEQRGVYCSIIFYLYCNGGSIELNHGSAITLLQGATTVLAQISGCRKVGTEWEAIWAKIANKFKITENILTHKRVTEELQRAENYRKSKSEAGKKGMAARWGDNTDITKVSKVKVSKGKETKESGRFTPPTIEEIQSLIQERKYTNVDPNRFFNFYASKGWMVGKNTMKDWKAALAGWQSRDTKPDSGTAPVQAQTYLPGQSPREIALARKAE